MKSGTGHFVRLEAGEDTESPVRLGRLRGQGRRRPDGTMFGRSGGAGSSPLADVRRFAEPLFGTGNGLVGSPLDRVQLREQAGGPTQRIYTFVTGGPGIH